MSQQHKDEDPYPPQGYAWYVVGVLTFVYIFSFIDRQILNLLVRPIRRDLGITDFQMSLLMGFSFALFYTFFGIPLGRLADSRSRRTIIAVGFAVWSLMTAGCGLARNFVQMLLLRVGVGVGEAALSPAAYSIITDYFPSQTPCDRHQRLFDGYLYWIGHCVHRRWSCRRTGSGSGDVERAAGWGNAALASGVFYCRYSRSVPRAAYVHSP